MGLEETSPSGDRDPWYPPGITTFAWLTGRRWPEKAYIRAGPAGPISGLGGARTMAGQVR
jgi:hypothetical protein